MDAKGLRCAAELVQLQQDLNSRISAYITEDALRRNGLEMETANVIEESLINLITDRFRFIRNSIEAKQ